MSYFCKSALFAAVFLAASPAVAASVLTFDGPYAPFVPYEQDGFVVDDGGVLFAADGALHIDIYLGPYADTRTITRKDGGSFDVHGVDIISLFPSVSAGGLTDAPRNDVRFEGFDDGALVSEALASSQVGDSTQLFGDVFSSITSFVITGFDAGNIDFEPMNDVHFLLDNLVVSGPGALDDPLPNVPLPASAWLLGVALVGLGIARRRGFSVAG